MIKFIILFFSIFCHLRISDGKATELKCGLKSISRPLRSVGNPRYGEAPWLVGIFKRLNSKENPEFLCAGTIINPSYVVTAAHCVADSELPDFVIAAGKLSKDFNIVELHQQTVKIANLLVHNNYQGNKNHYAADIALIKVDPPFNMTSAVAPACVEDLRNQNLPQSGTIIGWTFPRDNYKSDKSVEQKVSIISHEECLKRNDPFMTVFKNFIKEDKFCTIMKEEEIPEINSGGGVIYEKEGKYYLAGVVSVKARGQNIVLAHTNLADYYEFLHLDRIN